MRTMTTAAALLLSASALLGQGMAKAAPKAGLTWGPAPAVFPAGAQMAVVSGDPGKPAPFAVQLKMPDGYRIPPHFHPTDESVEVKEGTFLYAMGDTFDATKLQTMMVGEKGTIPATKHHYASAKGAVIVQVEAMGPFQLIYVNPADDPQAKK